MLVAAAMAGQIVSALQGVDKPAIANMKIGQAIGDYLCNNTTVMFSWAGLQPGIVPVPDPMVVTQSNKLLGTIVCTPTNATMAAQQGIQFGLQIQQGIMGLTVVPPPTFLIPPATFLAAAPIVLTPTQATQPFPHWLQWCNTIITTFKTYINPTPLPGTHLSFIGSPGAIMTAIL